MPTHKIAVRIFALGCAFTLLSACAGRGPASSSPTSASKDQLVDDQQKVGLALMRAGVSSAPSGPAAINDCSLIVGSGQQQLPIFQNLQSELSGILQDVQNKSQDDLDADIQKFQEALAKDITDLMTQIQTCIPESVQGGI